MLRLILPILFDIVPVHPPSFDINPAVNPWILFAGAVVAAISVLYLYGAQQKIAQRSIVFALTFIRVLLVLLVIALLLGPFRQWAYRQHSNGSLFVLVDQSLSMRQADAQSTAQERLQWASALGYLPEDLHFNSMGLQVNELIALRHDLDHFRSDAEHLLNDKSDSPQQQALAAHLDTWQRNLQAVASSSQIKPLAGDVANALHLAADSVAKILVAIHLDNTTPAPWIWTKIIGALLAIAAIVALLIWRNHSPMLSRAAPSICMALLIVALGLGGWAANQWPQPGEHAEPVQMLADNAPIPWENIHDTLTKAITQIAPVANAADKDFLNRYANDARVKNALDRVKHLDRAKLAYAALTTGSNRGLKSLAEMLGREEVKVIPFSDHNEIATAEKKELPSILAGILKDPAGQNTDIASALKFAAEQVGEDSTVLVVSDGRQNVGTEPEIPARLLAARGTRVFTLTMGSRELVRDAAVDHVDSPDWVYVEDEVAISPVIRLDGLRGEDVTVDLLRGDQVVQTRTIKAKTDQEKLRLRLTEKPAKEGVYDYSVLIRPVSNEAVADNNRQSVRVAVKKDKLNILLIDDEPDWEYQFLRNYLMRDKRVKLQVVLLSPAHAEEVQAPAPVLASPLRDDGKIDAQLLPSTREQWSAFDIVVMGDIPPEKLPPDQQQNIVAELRDGGIKALLLIAGQRNMPMRYAASPLADLIPVKLSASNWTPQELQDQQHHGYQPVPGPDGANSILGQFSDDFGTNTSLWANLPLWYSHSEQTAARPAANVIWSIGDAPSADPKPVATDATEQYETARQHALLSTMNVGLGRVLYLASPQTWRLRYVQTPGDDSHIEDVHRRFWGQVVRWAMGNDLPAGGKFVKFGSDKRSYIGGEPIVITARVLKEDFSPLQGATFKMMATGNKGTPAGETTMAEAPSEGPGIYRGTMTLQAGSFNLSVSGGEPEKLLANDTTVDPSHKTLPIEVAANSSVEDANVNADPDRMASIAAAGSGIAMDGCYFDVLANHLPMVDHTQTQIVQTGLFSNPDDPRTKLTHWAFFALFVVLITTEWILRKRGGLI